MSVATETKAPETAAPSPAPKVEERKTLLDSAPPPAPDTKVETKPSGQPPPVQVEGEKDTPAKPEADSKPTDAPPVVKYDLKAPDGSLLDAAHITKLEAFSKEQGLSVKQAQALMAREDERAEVRDEQMAAQLSVRADEQLALAKADKVFGGEKFVENMAIAQRGYKRHAAPELQKMLNLHRLGDNFAVVKHFHALGLMSKDDKAVIPGVTHEPPKPKSDGELFYPKKKTEGEE